MRNLLFYNVIPVKIIPFTNNDWINRDSSPLERIVCNRDDVTFVDGKRALVFWDLKRFPLRSVEKKSAIIKAIFFARTIARKLHYPLNQSQELLYHLVAPTR